MVVSVTPGQNYTQNVLPDPGTFQQKCPIEIDESWLALQQSTEPQKEARI